VSKDGQRSRAQTTRALLAAIGLALLGTPAACYAGDAAVAASRPEVEALESAYYGLLEFQKCVDRAPDAADLVLARERRRTTELTGRAEAKSLQPYLERAAAKWRDIDSRADKICYFQATGFRESSARLLRDLNDRFQTAVSRF
jgi:hypothetical protein